MRNKTQGQGGEGQTGHWAEAILGRQGAGGPVHRGQPTGSRSVGLPWEMASSAEMEMQNIQICNLFSKEENICDQQAEPGVTVKFPQPQTGQLTLWHQQS